MTELLQVQADVRELVDRVDGHDRIIKKLHQVVLTSTSRLAFKRASTKAYEQELQKHFWASSLISFLLGVSVGVISMNIFTSK